MAKTCCGIMTIVLIIPIIYFAYKIIVNAIRASTMHKIPTTPLDKLLKMKDELAQSPQYLEIKGKVLCDSPLKTPVSKIEAVYCRFKVIQYWTTPGGEDDVDHKKVICNVVLMRPFTLVEKGVEIPVVLSPKLRVEPKGEKEFEYPTPLSGDKLEGVSESEIRYAMMPNNAFDISYEYVEEYIAPKSKFYFIGDVKYADGVFYLMPGGSFSVATDKPEKKMIKRAIRERAGAIRWLFFLLVLLIFSFIGFYGKPEGLSEVLRNIMDFIIEAMEES